MALTIQKFVAALLKPARRVAIPRSQKHHFHDLVALDEHTLRDIGVNRFDVVAG